MGKNIPDISHYRPVKDWGKVKASCSFLISKATQGTNYTDPTLDEFIKGCEANKIPYWLYTFLEKADGKVQAKYMVDKCKSKVGKYFVGYIIDAEINPSKRTKPTDSQVKASLDYLSSLGTKWGLYTGYADYLYYKNSITKAKNASNGFWWEARYGKNDGTYSSKYPCNKGAALHQFTSNGICNGINGKIDLNRITNEVKELNWFMYPIVPITLPNTNVSVIDSNNSNNTNYYNKYTGTSKQVDIILKAIGVPSSCYGNVSKRTYIASANSISNYTGTADQNLKIISLAKNGKLRKVTATESYYNKYTGTSTMIDVVFKIIGVPSSYYGNVTKRKSVAVKNGISSYTGTATQNLKLISLAKSGKLKKV